MELGNFSFILNNHFIIRYCTAREGMDTPSDFHCGKGLRKWSRFFYLECGIIDFRSSSGETIRIRSGDILFLPYDVEYSSSWIDSRDGRYLSIEFILEYPDGRNLDLYDKITWLGSDSGQFRKLFREMINTVRSGTLGFQLKTQEQLIHLFYVMAMHVKGNDMRFADIQPAITAIEGDFCGGIDINELAECCHLSPATLRRRFLAYAGMSPIRYRNTLRLTKARELITTGLYKISEAAAIVGIPDVYYFSKIYKKQFGISPSADLPGTNETL